jgi:hypothetical protein
MNKLPLGLAASVLLSVLGCSSPGTDDSAQSSSALQGTCPEALTPHDVAVETARQIQPLVDACVDVVGAQTGTLGQVLVKCRLMPEVMDLTDLLLDTGSSTATAARVLRTEALPALDRLLAVHHDAQGNFVVPENEGSLWSSVRTSARDACRDRVMTAGLATVGLGDVWRGWRGVEHALWRSTWASSGPDMHLYGWLTPAPMQNPSLADLDQFLVRHANHLGAGGLVQGTPLEAEGPDAIPRFQAYALSTNVFGSAPNRAFEPVREALARIETRHVWFFTGRTPASDASFLVIEDTRGFVWGFAVLTVG